MRLSYPLGDFNVDGHVNNNDIPAMQTALTNLAAYSATYGLSASDLPGIGDFDGDLKFTNADMQGFLAYLQGGNGSLSAVPEPASLALVGMSIARIALVVRSEKRNLRFRRSLAGRSNRQSARRLSRPSGRSC